MNRRWAITSVALGAVAAGALGNAWYRQRQQERAAALEAKTGGFWALSFPRPDGSEFATKSLLGKPLVLNFWATWCPPCIKEMPELDRFHRTWAARGWQVLGLAIDSPTPVREYLAKRPVGYSIGLAGLDGTDLMRRIGNPLGGLPFTLAFDAEGFIAHQKLGETSFDELAGWATSMV